MNLESLTIADISAAIGVIVVLIGGFKYLSNTLKKWLKNLMDEQNKNLNNRLDHIENRLDIIDLETCKNYLVRFVSDVKRGEAINETERQRFYEQYEHYIAKGGNTYIKQEVENLQKKGKL